MWRHACQKFQDPPFPYFCKFVIKPRGIPKLSAFMKYTNFSDRATTSFYLICLLTFTIGLCFRYDALVCLCYHISGDKGPIIMFRGHWGF